MTKYWLSSLFGMTLLCALPNVGFAQYYGNEYSPRYYMHHGSYYEPSNYGSHFEPAFSDFENDRRSTDSGYSTYNWLKTGNYNQSDYYRSLSPSASYRPVYSSRGSDTGSYSPYYYLRYGSYNMPSYFGTQSGSNYSRSAQPSYSAPAYSSPSPTGEEQEEMADAPRRAFMQVQVSANADIWFEGDKTSQTGSVRSFVSPPLETGKKYTYDIRATWTDSNGKAVERTKQIKVQAGQRSMVNFTDQEASGQK